MIIVLIGNRAGKKRVNWPVFLIFALIVTLVSTLLVSGAYFLLAGRWNWYVPVLGAGAGLVIVLIALVSNLFARVERLPHIK